MGRFIDITGAPIASDFQEMPLDFMSKALDIQQKSKDTFDTARESMLPSEGGLASTMLKMPDGKLISLSQYEKDKYDKSLEDIAKVAINNPMEANRRFGIFKKQRDSDPVLKWAKEDFALKPTVINNEKAEDKAGTAVRSYRDKEGKVIPINVDDIISGKVSTPLEYYNSIGYSDFTTPTRTFIKDIKGIEGMTSSTIKPYLDEIAGIGSMIAQGKSATKFDRQTMDNLQKGINTAVDYLLNSKSAASRSFKAIYGIIDGNGNPLVDEATAKQLATKFVLEQADDFTYDNKSTTTDMSWSLPSKGDSGDGNKNGNDEESVEIPAGSIYTKQGENLVLKAIAGKTREDLAKDATMAASKLLVIKNLDATNPDLARLGKSLVNPKTGLIDFNKLTPAILDDIIIAANKNKDPNITTAINSLAVAKRGFDLLQDADVESDVIARQRSGFTEKKAKEYEGIRKDIEEELLKYATAPSTRLIITDNGTIKALISGGAETMTKSIIRVVPENIPLFTKYIKDIQDSNSEFSQYRKIKQEEYNKRTNPNYEYAQNWTAIKWAASSDGEHEKKQLNNAVHSNITNLIRGTGDKESIIVNDAGEAVDLKEYYPDPEDVNVIAHVDNPDGTTSVKFKLKKSAPTPEGKIKVSGEDVFILKTASPIVTEVLKKYNNPVYTFEGRAKSTVADWERNVLPQTKRDGTPYIKTVYHDKNPIKIQNVDGINNYTFVPNKEGANDFVDFYNKYVVFFPNIEKISIDANYGKEDIGVIISTYEMLKDQQTKLDKLILDK
jgi:hypothetical protein